MRNKESVYHAIMFKFILAFVVIVFFGCQKLMHSYNHTSRVNSHKLGVWIECVDSDSISFEIVRYKNGIKSGKARTYYSDGSISIGYYKKDKKQGAWKCYNSSKKLYRIEYYTEGFLGRIEFIENGKVASSVITDPVF